MKPPVPSPFPFDVRTARKTGGRTDPGSLDEYRLSALRAAVARARRNSPFFRSRLASYPEGFPRSLGEYGALPFTTPDDLAAIENLPAGGMERLGALNDAMNALIAPDDVRKEFLALEALVRTFYQAVKPDPAALEFAGRAACLGAIADAIQAVLHPDPVDIGKILGQVKEVLDISITGTDMPGKPAPLIDLSKIDLEALRKRLEKSKHRNTDLEMLKAAIRAQLEKLIRFNRTRTDYLEKFEELIENYNNGSQSIEETLKKLLNLTGRLTEEEHRHIRENLSEEQLTVYDILTRPGPELTTEEREEVKKVARQVLARLNSLLALDWRRQTQARAKVRLAIEDTLDGGLPKPYTPEIYQSKCSALFEHVYESYYGEGDGIFVFSAS